jgi:uncharacterized protein YndB with AHSA1/START domain
MAAMKFELGLERIYPHPPEALWRALSDRMALGEWLMETDFTPELGRSFTLWCDDGIGGTDTYVCSLLDYDPPRRMLWSWRLEGSQHQDDTYVEFKVEPATQGTKVTVTHSGDRDPATIEKFRGGWPDKLDRLGHVLLGSNPVR